MPKTLQKFDTVRGVLTTGMAVLAAIMTISSCVYDWETVDSVSNDDYEVVAKVQSTDATTPTVLTITSHSSNGVIGRGKRLVKLVGWHDQARCEIMPPNVLLAASCYDPGDYYKLYFLANLDSPPSDKFEIWSNYPWIDGDPIWSDAAGGNDFTLNLLKEPTRDFHISCDGPHLSFDLFVLGANDVTARLVESGYILLDVGWREGETTTNLKLALPDHDTGWVIPAGAAESADLRLGG